MRWIHRKRECEPIQLGVNWDGAFFDRSFRFRLTAGLYWRTKTTNYDVWFYWRNHREWPWWRWRFVARRSSWFRCFCEGGSRPRLHKYDMQVCWDGWRQPVAFYENFGIPIPEEWKG